MQTQPLIKSFKMECSVVDPGSYKTESVHQVKLSHEHGGVFNTTYTMGAGHRVWTRNVNDGTHKFDGTKGNAVPYIGNRKLSVLQHETLTQHTEARAPRLGEVLWSLSSDALTVWDGQTFSDWASELGYDDDSRKAEKAYNGCRDTADFFRRCGLDHDDMVELSTEE